MTAPRLPPLPPLAPEARVWLAYSGGVDSTALLHLLKEAAVPRLCAVHVHHGLQAVADDWVRHCRAECQRLAVPLTVLHAQVDPVHREGPEGGARAARYQALRQLLRADDVLVTAHHQDDQAETVLLRLLRGTGIDGVQAMASLSAFPPGRLWRPLLRTRRAALLRYAEDQGLSWVQDPHNADPRYARSWLRTALLPPLLQRWPQAVTSLTRFAENAADAHRLLVELAELDLGAASRGSGLSVTRLLALSPHRRHHVLRHWMQKAGGLAPPRALLARIDRELLQARPDAQPRLRFGALELRRYRDQVFLMPQLLPTPQASCWRWPAGAAELVLPAECGRLQRLGALAVPLQVRLPGGGERLRPENQVHLRQLKNLFQEAAVPPWVRERTPLIYGDNELLAVADLWRSRKAAELGLSVVWTHNLPGLGRNGD